jgi:hypothetical protein
VSPILGILASSGFPQVGDFESIATVTVGAGGASSISFTGIVGTYKHLQVRYISRCDRADVTDSLAVRFNSDSGTNYTRHLIYGYNSSASALASTAETYNRSGVSSASLATANVFAAGVYDILDYSSTNKNKTLRVLCGSEDNTALGSELRFGSGLWLNTAAITSLTFLANGGSSNFVQYSSFALYGIK